MTETSEAAPKRRSGTGLSGMLLPELKQVAAGLGIKGVGGMRKSQLIDAIKAAQSGGQPAGDNAAEPTRPKGEGSAQKTPADSKTSASQRESQEVAQPRGDKPRDEKPRDEAA